MKKNKFVEKMLKNQAIVLQYDDYKHRINLQKKYYGTTKLYLHQSAKSSTARNVIDINFYKLFLEKYHSLLKKGGIGGVVLPASVLLDLGSKGLRELILNDSKILSIYEFENKKAIFEEIHRQYRFITLLFKKGEKTISFKSAFHLRDIEKLTSLDSEALDYKVDLIKKMSPNSLAILECRNQLEVDILKKLFKFPHIFEEKDDGWNIKLQREFDMTDDSYLFNTEGKGTILYEGKMIHQFDHLYKEPRYWIETDKGKESLRKKND